MIDYNDLPEKEILQKIQDVMLLNGTFWGKFTCKHCGARQTFEKSNLLFRKGICEECGQTSDLDRWGLMVVYNVQNHNT